MKTYTAEDVLNRAAKEIGSDDPPALAEFLARNYAALHRLLADTVERHTQLEGMFDTVVACLVKQLGGEARIPRSDIEDPPDLIEDDDPLSGDWIYATGSRKN